MHWRTVNDGYLGARLRRGIAGGDGERINEIMGVEYIFEIDLKALYNASINYDVSENDQIESLRMFHNLETYILGLEHWRDTALQLSKYHGEAEADAERLATEYEATLREIGGVYWEEPGERSPALIAHKNRLAIK